MILLLKYILSDLLFFKINLIYYFVFQLITFFLIYIILYIEKKGKELNLVL